MGLECHLCCNFPSRIRNQSQSIHHEYLFERTTSSDDLVAMGRLRCKPRVAILLNHRCRQERHIPEFRIPEFRKPGIPTTRTSENPEVRKPGIPKTGNSENPEFRKPGIPNTGNSENAEFRKSGIPKTGFPKIRIFPSRFFPSVGGSSFASELTIAFEVGRVLP